MRYLLHLGGLLGLSTLFVLTGLAGAVAPVGP
jgi:hypothetical protein